MRIRCGKCGEFKEYRGTTHKNGKDVDLCMDCYKEEETFLELKKHSTLPHGEWARKMYYLRKEDLPPITVTKDPVLSEKPRR